ncbi:MAG: hypothetical protein E6K56_03230 [Ignavibacteria bacterium]|nr:MAG: hypothetical protein E6K56_03230 [Ignavibacteria bacterium]
MPISRFFKRSAPATLKKLLLSIVLAHATASAQIPEFKIAFSNEVLPATFEHAGKVWKDVQIRFKGRSNRYFPKKSYRIKFPAKHHFNGVHQLNLHSMYTDKSFLREKLSWDFFADLGMLAPRASYARLTINGAYQGLYAVVDRVDKNFLALHGKTSASLYNAGGFYSLADLTVQPKELLKLYYPKEIGEEDDYPDLLSMLDSLNKTPDSLFAVMLGRLFDINSVYNWFAGNIILSSGDSYTKNYYLYHDPSRRSQQWVIIPWDYDESMGLTGDMAVPYPGSLLNDGFDYRFPPLAGPSNVLRDRLWKNPALREALRRRVDTILRTVFTEERMDARIDSLVALIHTDVAADSQKWGTYQDFLDNVQTVRYYVTARRNFLLATYINPPSGINNNVTVKTTKSGVAYHFVGLDGSQIATLWLSHIRGLDSVRIERRWLRITPIPAAAKFTGKLEWMYHDASSMDREVGKAVKDERSLRCFWHGTGGWIPVASHINPFANLVTVESITEKQCAEGTYFGLFLPQ